MVYSNFTYCNFIQPSETFDYVERVYPLNNSSSKCFTFSKYETLKQLYFSQYQYNTTNLLGCYTFTKSYFPTFHYHSQSICERFIKLRDDFTKLREYYIKLCDDFFLLRDNFFCLFSNPQPFCGRPQTPFSLSQSLCERSQHPKKAHRTPVKGKFSSVNTKKSSVMGKLFKYNAEISAVNSHRTKKHIHKLSVNAYNSLFILIYPLISFYPGS